MKKNIGKKVTVYPTPTTVVGTVDENGKVNWIHIAHIAPTGTHNQFITLSMNNMHLSNKLAKENKVISINMIDRNMLIKSDYIGMKSGKILDKSNIFEYEFGELDKAPLIKESPVSMECEVVDIYDRGDHTLFTVTVKNTYAMEEYLTDGKVDLDKLTLMLFDFQGPSYIESGKKIGKPWSMGREHHKNMTK